MISAEIKKAGFAEDSWCLYLQNQYCATKTNAQTQPQLKRGLLDYMNSKSCHIFVYIRLQNKNHLRKNPQEN